MKYFKIRGSFVRSHLWVEPGFEGSILIDDNGYLRGCVEQLVPESWEEPPGPRYLVGKTGVNKASGKNGVAFYKLIDGLEDWPSLYIIPNLQDENSGYYCLYFGPMIGWLRSCSAKIVLEEEPLTTEKVGKVLQDFAKLDRDSPNNARLLREIDYCERYVEEGSH